MNFDFAIQINPSLEKLQFDEALSIAQAEMRKIRETVFHHILDKPLTGQAGELASWIDEFFLLAAEKGDVKALYFEMNEFDINTDHWYIDGYAYENDGGLNPVDMDWLSDFGTDSRTETGTVFRIEGYEELQEAFETVQLCTEDLQNSRDWCEQIIISRFMELMVAAHLSAGEQRLGWGSVPIYFTEHGYDFIVRSGKAIS